MTLPRDTRRFLDERIRAAVRAPYDRAVLEPLRQQAGLFRGYLMTDDGRVTLADLEPNADLDWLNEIYEAISEVPEDAGGMAGQRGLHEAPAPFMVAEGPPHRQEFDEPSAAVHPTDREDALVGQAFEELLVHDLPPKLVKIGRFFAEVEPADSAVQAALRTTPSVVAAGPVAQRLVRYGITPIAIVNASQAIATAVRRHYRTHHLPRNQGVVIDYRSVCNDPEGGAVLSRRPLCEDVSLGTELLPAVSERLFDWLISVAKCKPLLFDRFRAREVDLGLLLEPTAERVDLFTAWRATTPGAGSERGDARSP